MNCRMSSKELHTIPVGNGEELFTTLVDRLSQLIRVGAPPGPPASLKNPEVATEMANELGVSREVQLVVQTIGGPNALSEILSDAFEAAQEKVEQTHGKMCGGSHSVKKPVNNPSTSKSTRTDSEDFSQEAHVANLAHLNDKDSLIQQLWHQHVNADDVWKRIANDYKALTGDTKSKHFFKKCVSKLGPEAFINQVAFQETTQFMNDVFPGSLPNRAQFQMRDESEALLGMLWQDLGKDSADVAQFFIGMAIQTGHAEKQPANSLIQVSSYLIEHPASKPARQELKALLCFLTACQLSGNTMKISSLDVQERAVELFALGFLQSDVAFGLFVNSGPHLNEASEAFEAMERMSSKVLQRNCKSLPAKLVKSRLQKTNGEKLHFLVACLNLLGENCNERWKSCRQRLHELVGLCYGSMGDFTNAQEQYSLAVADPARISSHFLEAQCLLQLEDDVKANICVDMYLSAVAADGHFDTYLLPNALYLKGLIMTHSCKMEIAKAYCKQAEAAEYHRCPFFEPVDTAAKRSLCRIVKVALGSAQEREAALVEFANAYKNRASGTTCGKSNYKTVNLEDCDLEQLRQANGGNSITCSSDSSLIRVHVLHFSRHPAELGKALFSNEILVECNRKLVEHGKNADIPCGAKVFADPEDFDFVTEALQDHLKPYHVVVAPQFLGAAKDAVSSIRSKLQVRQKNETRATITRSFCQTCGMSQPQFICSQCKETSYCSDKCQKADLGKHRKICRNPFGEEWEVQHTFVDLKLPSSLRSTQSAVTKSTTDADARKGQNPRSV